MTINLPGPPPTEPMAQQHSVLCPPNVPLMASSNSSLPLSPPAVTPEQEHLTGSSLQCPPKRSLETQSIKSSIELKHRLSATYRALGDPKVLENILYFLDSRTLLRCPGVSRFWLEVIVNSPLLRRHLWIDPSPQPGRNSEPYINPFLTTFRSNLAINAFVKREYSDATDFVLRFARKNKLLKLKLGGGSWMDMMVFLPSERAVGALTVQVEDDDVPCIYDVIPVEIDWGQTVKLGALVDLVLAS
ncbi:hypothetical protein CERZMDRAFT_93227 [Cercospora zeae-maydis SCOH1-5]|uniref:Uncharacterized protein n=1 Tax=Cercospora zeae-maydis SCOH1-5 TaxID=717836 RepID=A0A6A6FV08_9PEZI|nr:hypothetical protein CERZMDRAFT_93227 [Cercospora zeae-maydis SCOH1-5]